MNSKKPNFNKLNTFNTDKDTKKLVIGKTPPKKKPFIKNESLTKLNKPVSTNIESNENLNNINISKSNPINHVQHNDHKYQNSKMELTLTPNLKIQLNKIVKFTEIKEISKSFILENTDIEEIKSYFKEKNLFVEILEGKQQFQNFSEVEKELISDINICNLILRVVMENKKESKIKHTTEIEEEVKFYINANIENENLNSFEKKSSKQKLKVCNQEDFLLNENTFKTNTKSISYNANNFKSNKAVYNSHIKNNLTSIFNKNKDVNCITLDESHDDYITSIPEQEDENLAKSQITKIYGDDDSYYAYSGENKEIGNSNYIVKRQTLKNNLVKLSMGITEKTEKEKVCKISMISNDNYINDIFANSDKTGKTEITKYTLCDEIISKEEDLSKVNDKEIKEEAKDKVCDLTDIGLMSNMSMRRRKNSKSKGISNSNYLSDDNYSSKSIKSKIDFHNECFPLNIGGSLLKKKDSIIQSIETESKSIFDVNFHKDINFSNFNTTEDTDGKSRKTVGLDDIFN